MALAVGCESPPNHTHRFSPKIYTQSQLFACLVYMIMLRTDYRGCEAHLRDLPGVCEWIGLKRVPAPGGTRPCTARRSASSARA